jgi:hypothetical protein
MVPSLFSRTELGVRGDDPIVSAGSLRRSRVAIGTWQGGAARTPFHRHEDHHREGAATACMIHRLPALRIVQPGRRSVVAAHPARASRRLILLTTLAAAAGSPAALAEENECRRPPALSAGPSLALGRIVAPSRTAFVQDGLARPGCPDPSPACRERAYLVTGDAVILGKRRGGFVCAAYRSGTNESGRTGWIPAEAVSIAPPPPVTRDDWLGTWTRAAARIRVEPGTKPGSLTVAGDAIWGMGDPDRVSRGGIHTGEFAGTVTPAGDAVSFAVGESGALPVEAGSADDCKVWLRRIGAWLVVDDNFACGGVNVTFRGVYRRQP